MPSPTQCISRFRVCASINAGSIGLSLMLSLVLPAPGLAGTTYKWVDERGHVHFSDTPPAKTPYETVETPPAQSMSPPTQVAPEAPPGPGAPPTAPQAANGAQADDRCVDALYQIALLDMHRRVFKPGPDGERRYLENDDRPAEVARLSRLRDENCSSTPELRASQETRAHVLMRALSPGCADARRKLELMEDPDTRSVDQDLESQRAFVRNHCPDIQRDDVWLGDYVIVRIGPHH